MNGHPGGAAPGTEVRMASSPFPRVHPSAVIDPAARLAADVTVGPYAVIEGPVVLGPGCVIRPHVHLIGPLTLGRDNVVGTGTVLGDRPQHVRFDGAPTGVVAGDGNVFREHVTVHSGTLPEGTRIGHKNYFMAHSHVAHDCRLGDQCILANGALLGGHVEVAGGVFISGNCAVHQFSRIGRLAMMSGGATISKDIPPFFMVEGRNRLVGVNVVGLRRAGMDNADIQAIREAYRILYMQRKVLPAAVEAIEHSLGGAAVVAELVAFIRDSKRGIISSCGYWHAA
jgi:UDP-N-acetylglucosamine acyltransferase